MFLLDLFMNRHFLEDGVVFFQLYPVGSVLLVLGGDVARGAGHAGRLVLGALEDHLYPVLASCHFLSVLSTKTCRQW